MWCLWDLGRMSEKIFGGWTYLLIYNRVRYRWEPRQLVAAPDGRGPAGASGRDLRLGRGAYSRALYLGKLPYPGQALRGMMRSLPHVLPDTTSCLVRRFRVSTTSAHIGGAADGIGSRRDPWTASDRGAGKTPGSRNAIVFHRGGISLLVGMGTLVKRQNGYVCRVLGGVRRPSDPAQIDRAIAELQSTVARKPNNKAALSLLGSAYPAGRKTTRNAEEHTEAGARTRPPCDLPAKIQPGADLRDDRSRRASTPDFLPS